MLSPEELTELLEQERRENARLWTVINELDTELGRAREERREMQRRLLRVAVRLRNDANTLLGLPSASRT